MTGIVVNTHTARVELRTRVPRVEVRTSAPGVTVRMFSPRVAANLRSGTVVVGAPARVGRKGDPGKSAYQTWLDLGNAGSAEDFIASLAVHANAIDDTAISATTAYSSFKVEARLDEDVGEPETDFALIFRNALSKGL